MSRLYKILKKYHKWLALIFTLFFIFFALSGILLNHRSLISGVDVNRKWLPKSYELKDWNLASAKGSIEVGKDSLLFYGGAGIWLTDSLLKSWTPFMAGLPKGSDRRKVFDLVEVPNGDYFAATRFGLYHYSLQTKHWAKQPFAKDDEFVTSLEVAKGKLYVLTRNHLYESNISTPTLSFSKVDLIPPQDEKPRISIFRLFWVIHSGEVLGMVGRLVVDLGGLMLLFLSITGLIYFIFPKIIKRVKAKQRLSRLKKINKYSFNWHLKVGIYSSILLLIVSFTGIFLRPPFLILVANGGVNLRSDSKTGYDVFWRDKLRDIKYDSKRDCYMIVTSDGILYCRSSFNTRLERFHTVPPISIMGINVFEVLSNGNYLVGSFSGAYYWNPYEGYIINYFTGEPVETSLRTSSPFGSVAIAGYSKVANNEFFFDYDKGVISKSSKESFDMPQVVKDAFPFPLWNLAQEIHTCRIYSPLIGFFYILIVPLAGISLFFVTVTGAWMWFVRRRRVDS